MTEMVAEHLVLALVGGAAGVALAQLTLGVVKQWAGNRIPRVEEVALDPAVLLFSLGVSLFVGLLLGLLPAWQLAKPDLVDALKDMTRDRGLRDSVIVNRTSCLKHCSRGVTVAVQPDNVWYANVRPEDLEEICSSHLEAGRPVERLAMPDIPWE